MESNSILIQKFYSAFQNLDPEAMAACYHDQVQFQDPVFNKLSGKDPSDMWRMLISRGGASLKISFSDIISDETSGSAAWEARYMFSKTNRNVHNKIKATFKFKDGKIIEHNDHFNFWKWSQMALGLPGYILGWSSSFKKKVSDESLKALKKFQEKSIG